MNFKRFGSLLPDNPLCGISTYKDELNLATGACARQIKKWVLDGTEPWREGQYPPLGGYQFFTAAPSEIAADRDWITTHFKKGNVLNGSVFTSYLSLYPEASILPENATINDFKAWLAAQYAAGTPVTVWYVLATSTTETITVPTGLSGTEEGYLNQSGTPTPTNPIYPTANEVKVWHDLTDHIMSTTWQDGSTYSRSGGSWSSSLTKKRSRKKK